MKILNLYAGLGGNRQLWGNDHSITAIELNSKIADVYKKLYPKDEMIVGDAHEYLLYNFQKFDFIWSSPVCKTHSRLNTTLGAKNIYRYPDMSLYQEIILLSNFYKGFWVVENTIPYYPPLVPPRFKIDRHIFWSNFYVSNFSAPKPFAMMKESLKQYEKFYQIPSDLLKGLDKIECYRNMVVPEVGKHILESLLKRNIIL